MTRATARLRVILVRSLWLVPVAATALAIHFTGMAWQTGFELLAEDPCATGWDNEWSLASSRALWAALISSAVLTVFAIRRKSVAEASLGMIAIFLIEVLSVICWLVANGGYGWHCD